MVRARLLRAARRFSAIKVFDCACIGRTFGAAFFLGFAALVFVVDLLETGSERIEGISFDSGSDAFHQIEIICQVVNGQQTDGSNFLGDVQVPDICS